MNTFLVTSSNFRLPNFNTIIEEQAEDHNKMEKGIILVNEWNDNNNEKKDNLLIKLDNLKKIIPNKTSSNVNSYRYILNALNDEVPDAILSIQLAIIQKVDMMAQNYSKVTNKLKKDVNNYQTQLISCNIILFNFVHNNTNFFIFFISNKCIAISLLHQEVTKTKFYLTQVFISLHQVKQQLDDLYLNNNNNQDSNSIQLNINPHNYPNLYKLTYKQRIIRPNSYHYNYQQQQHSFLSEVITNDFKPRSSLDLPLENNSWNNFKDNQSIKSFNSNSPYLYNNNNNNNSSTSLNPEENFNSINNNSSLIAGAISKVHFATSKAYRQPPQSLSEAMSPIHSGSSDGSIINIANTTNNNSMNSEITNKKKAFSLRTTLSLANLKSLKKSSEGITNTTTITTSRDKQKPLNAKDRLSQIASSSPKPSNVILSKWISNVFRTHESSNNNNITTTSMKSQLNQETSQLSYSEAPKLPKLEGIDYRINISTEIPGMEEIDNIFMDKNLNGEFNYSLNSSPRSLTRSFSSASTMKNNSKRRPSLRSLLLDHPSFSSPSQFPS
ncbi:hypothetical protein K502DRAFT_341363 [Neoconidiobolus thromboides FSU 785]|nr:hypothetical protein K502DRAFT_341363 [Neoconidiobolus thromboides FSU 785]